MAVEILSNSYIWSQFSGTIWNGFTLNILPLDRRIRPKSNNISKWYYNPPINLVGPYINLNNKNVNIEILIDVSKTPSKYSYIDLYGTLPICYDEWRIDGHNIRFSIKNNIIELYIDMVKQKFQDILKDNIKLSITNKNSIIVNGKEITCSVFKNQKLYFGFDAELGGGFEVKSIKIENGIIENNNTIVTYPLKDNTLKFYANKLKRPISIGTCINADALLSDKMYGQILAENFSIVTPENHFKFQFIHPQKDLYSFAESDAIVDFCIKNNIKIHGHCLVWHEALPQWIWDLYNKKDYSTLRKSILDHITVLVTRYKGKITEWDTLNEIFSISSNDKEGFRKDKEDDNFESIWFKSFGKQIYIDVLKKVKEIDPSIENWINDFGIDQKGFKSLLKKMITFINNCNNLGFGKLIDGIGFQCHNYDPEEDPSIASELKKAMNTVTKNGIKVRISELDVDLASKRPTLFSDKLEVAIENNNCTSYSMWGFTDLYGSMSEPSNSTKSIDNYISPNWSAILYDSLIYDKNYKEKTAVNALKMVLS